MELNNDKPVDYGDLKREELIAALQKRDEIINNDNAVIRDYLKTVRELKAKAARLEDEADEYESTAATKDDKIDGLKQAMRRQLEATSELLETL